MAAVRLKGEVGVALAVIGLAAFIGYETFSITVSPGYARVGPRVVPFAVAGLLAVLGTGLLIAALSGVWSVPASPGRKLMPLLTIIGGLAAYIALLKPMGFILASAILFVAIARAFASERIFRDAGIGLALSLMVFLLFTQLLQLPLPDGWLWVGR